METIRLKGITCHYETEGDTLFMNIEPNAEVLAKASMQDIEEFFAIHISNDEGIEFKHIAYLNLEAEPKPNTDQAPKAPRWLHGIHWIVGAFRVLVMISAIVYFKVSAQWAIPLMVVLNFVLGYAIGPYLTPIEIAREAEDNEAQNIPSPNNEKALL